MRAWKITFSYQLLKFPSLRFGQTFTVDTSSFFIAHNVKGRASYGYARAYPKNSVFVLVGDSYNLCKYKQLISSKQAAVFVVAALDFSSSFLIGSWHIRRKNVRGIYSRFEICFSCSTTHSDNSFRISSISSTSKSSFFETLGVLFLNHSGITSCRPVDLFFVG